jgi:ribosomal protein L29
LGDGYGIKMAVLRAKEIQKMNEKDRKDKLKDLKLELVKANVAANRTNAKTKEIKRAISRLLTALNSKKFDKSVQQRKEKLIKK